MEDSLLLGIRDGIGKSLQVEQEYFGITHTDRARHLYCFGKTGMGKSTLLESMITQDIIGGRGVALLDPHGDLAERVITRVPPHRVNDVIYFSPADMEYPIGINFLSNVSPDKRFLTTEHILSVFSHIWGLSPEYSPRLLHILRNVISALLEKQGTTLLGIYRMLIDEQYRDMILASIGDSMTKMYWEEEFEGYDNRKRGEVSESTLNKIGALLTSPIIRNCVGQVKNRIDFRSIVDDEKILICNLSKGRIGEEGSKLIGSMISIKLYLATMERAEVREDERVPFYLYVDEFQNYGNSVYENMFSESRKYKLRLTVANQYTDQLPIALRNAVFGNVGSIISFQTNSNDGELLAKEFSGAGSLVKSHAFSDLQPFEVHSRLQTNGVLRSPFRGYTLPPPNITYNFEQSVINHTRSRYAVPRSTVEARINNWLLSGK